MEKTEVLPKVQAKAYVGCISNSAIGEWITLPMDSKELDARLSKLFFNQGEFEIMDIIHDLPISLLAYKNIWNLNQDLKEFQSYEESFQLSLLMTAYSYRDNDMASALSFLNVGTYEFYEEVSSEKELGEAVVESGRFGWLLGNPTGFDYLLEVRLLKEKGLVYPHLIRQYMDYEAIGHERVCNGCIIYPKLKTAMMELSS